ALLEHVDEATGARILVGSERSLSFAHDLFREMLYDGLASRERQRLHQVVAETLERMHEGEVEMWLPDLAHHFFLAGQEQSEKAVLYSVRAAERASRAFAHADAVAHYRRALRVLSSPGATDARTRCRVQLALGESLWSAGEFDDARQVY